MRSLPTKQRQQMQKKLRDMDNQKDKTAYMNRMMERSKKYERWSAAEVYEELSYANVQECVDALEKHFLTVPLSRDQRQVLVKSLAQGKPADEVAAATIPEDAKNATLHLLLSTAEYQLT